VVSTVFFNNESVAIYDRLPLSEVPSMTDEDDTPVYTNVPSCHLFDSSCSFQKPSLVFLERGLLNLRCNL